MGSMPAGKPLSIQLAEKLQHYGLKNASEQDVMLTTHAFIDTIACMYAGCEEPAVQKLTSIVGRNPGPALLVGSRTGQKTSLLDAACLNAVAAHALDYDDMAGGGHPSAPMIPGLLALASELAVPGTCLIDAYLVGFEVQNQLTNALFPHHYNVGWHPTATIGTFGAAVAASRLLRLNPEQVATAIALCASLASGLKANFGTMTKPLHVGQCTRNGLMAALLAKEGFTASHSALEHEQGFFQAFDGIKNVDVDRLRNTWPATHAISREPYGVKQFPNCGSTHPAIAAVFDMLSRQKNRLNVENIDAIDVQLHKERIPHTNNPNPTTALAAKFSVQYATARALVSGKVQLVHFEMDSVTDPAVNKLLRKVTVRPFEEHKGHPSDPWASTVTVTLQDGTCFTGVNTGYVSRGSQNPMSRGELWDKLADCSKGVLAPEGSQAVFADLWNMRELDNVQVLLETMERASTQ